MHPPLLAASAPLILLGLLTHNYLEALHGQRPADAVLAGPGVAFCLVQLLGGRRLARTLLAPAAVPDPVGAVHATRGAPYDRSASQARRAEPLRQAEVVRRRLERRESEVRNHA